MGGWRNGRCRNGSNATSPRRRAPEAAQRRPPDRPRPPGPSRPSAGRGRTLGREAPPLQRPPHRAGRPGREPGECRLCAGGRSRGVAEPGPRAATPARVRRGRPRVRGPPARCRLALGRVTPGGSSPSADRPATTTAGTRTRRALGEHGHHAACSTRASAVLRCSGARRAGWQWPSWRPAAGSSSSSRPRTLMESASLPRKACGVAAADGVRVSSMTSASSMPKLGECLRDPGGGGHARVTRRAGARVPRPTPPGGSLHRIGDADRALAISHD